MKRVLKHTTKSRRYRVFLQESLKKILEIFMVYKKE